MSQTVSESGSQTVSEPGSQTVSEPVSQTVSDTGSQTVCDPVCDTASAQAGDGGAEVGRGVVPEFDDAGMAIEGVLDDAALHAAAAPVHEPHLGQSPRRGFGEVFLDHGADVGWCERMEVELGPDGHLDRFVHWTDSN